MAKLCPGCGYREQDNQAVYCNKCGYPFPQSPPARMAMATAPARRPAPRPVRRPRRKAGGSGFLSFGTLIAETYIKPVYILGAVLIVLVSIMGIAGMFAKPAAAHAVNLSITNTSAIAQDPAGAPLFWFGFLVVASILWRMFCELFVMLSRVQGGHGQEMGTGYDEPGDYGEEEEAGPDWEGSGQMVECPLCRKIVPIEELQECEHCGIQGCSNCVRKMGLLKKTVTCRQCYEGK